MLISRSDLHNSYLTAIIYRFCSISILDKTFRYFRIKINFNEEKKTIIQPLLDYLKTFTTGGKMITDTELNTIAGEYGVSLNG